MTVGKVCMLSMRNGCLSFIDMDAFDIYHGEPFVDRSNLGGELFLSNGPRVWLKQQIGVSGIARYWNQAGSMLRTTDTWWRCLTE